MTKIDPATVTIERAPPVESRAGTHHVKGRQIIKVAGVPYGRIEMHQHGGRGNSYTFEQLAGQRVQRKGTVSSLTGKERFYDVTVSGDKMESRYRRLDDPPLEPIAKRLHAMAVELVQSGQLISESAQKKLVAERNKQYRDEEQARKSEEMENFRCRARMALGINDDAQSDVVDNVVKAMKWAQSQ